MGPQLFIWGKVQIGKQGGTLSNRKTWGYPVSRQNSICILWLIVSWRCFVFLLWDDPEPVYRLGGRSLQIFGPDIWIPWRRTNGGMAGDMPQGWGRWNIDETWSNRWTKLSKSSPGSKSKNTLQLVGGLEHFLFFHILGILIPTD